MRRSALFVLGAVIIVGILVRQPSSAQGNKKGALWLSVVGIGVKHDDYQASLNFYTKVMGFRSAFSFSPPNNANATNTYIEISRDTFVELGEVGPNGRPGFSHIHLGTDDADAVVARLQGAGGKLCSDTLKTGCLRNTRLVEPTHERSATIIDPSGILYEPTQFIANSMAKKAVDSWTNKGDALRLMVVGIAVSDYPESENFYEKVLGFPIAFKFSSPDGKRTTKYYQISRDTFLEMQSATADVPPGITHVHIQTQDLNATIARLQQSGLASSPRNSTAPNTVTEPGMVQPSNVRSANVFDPIGLRLELNELIPESLTKKAMDSWKGN
jgi:catechol 2,3-dioxygenase-like lactoylglutathione lyase family enzyme